MKITLSFPQHGDKPRPEQIVEAITVPLVGELVSWNTSANMEVYAVVHHFSDNELPHRVTVQLEECGTRRRKLAGQQAPSFGDT